MFLNFSLGVFAVVPLFVSILVMFLDFDVGVIIVDVLIVDVLTGSCCFCFYGCCL